MADAAAEPAGGSRTLMSGGGVPLVIPLLDGAKPRAWYSPTHGYIVWERHPLQATMHYTRAADRRILDTLPADAAEFILKEPWRRFSTEST